MFVRKKKNKSGTIKKESINRRGYNKFLEITNDVEITINEEKILEDERWDRWKGYITNTDIAAKEIASKYHELWVVERAFRVTKGNLGTQPVFHFTSRRIEANICICFIAYKVYKEQERIMKLMKFPMSVDKAPEIAKTTLTITIRRHSISKNRPKPSSWRMSSVPSNRYSTSKSILDDTFPKSGIIVIRLEIYGMVSCLTFPKQSIVCYV